MYTYNILTDIVAAKVNLDKLELDINSSSMGIMLVKIDLNGNDISIEFTATLSVEQKTTLDSVVNLHDGLEIAETVKAPDKVLPMPFASNILGSGEIINKIEKNIIIPIPPWII